MNSISKTTLAVVLLLLSICDVLNAQTQSTAEDYLKRGITHFKAGDLDLALKEANAAIQMNPSLVDAYRLRILIFASKDPEWDESGDCDMIVRLAPNAPTTEPFYVCRANSRARKLDWIGATSDMNVAIRLNPNNGDYYSFRAYIDLCGNDLVRARADYERGLQLKPGVPSPFIRRGYFRYWGKDFLGAVDDFTRAIEWKPDYAEAYAERAFAWGLSGNINQAIADLRKAVVLNPQSITDHIPQNSFAAPFGSVNTFIKFHPTNARAFEMRGIFNWLQNKQSDAANDFNNAVALQPALKEEIDRIIATLKN